MDKTKRIIGWILLGQFGTVFAGLFWATWVFISLGLAIIGLLLLASIKSKRQEVVGGKNG